MNTTSLRACLSEEATSTETACNAALHHSLSFCRMCGRIFCSNCSSNYIYPDGFRADQGPARVCNYCELDTG